MFFSRKKEDHKSQNLMHALGSLVARVPFSEKTAENFLKEFLDLLGVSSGSFFMYHREENSFILKHRVGLQPLLANVSAQNEVINYLQKTGLILIKDEVLQENRYQEIRSAALHYLNQTSSHGILPLRLGQEWVGLIHLGSALDAFFISEEGHAFLQQASVWLSLFFLNDYLTARLNIQERKNQEMEEIKNQILMNVTHEMRTPLHGILGLLDLIVEGGDGEINEDQKRHLEMMQASAQSLLSLVNNILSLVKAQADQQQRVTKRLDLSRMIGEIHSLFEVCLSEKENQFVSHIHDNLTVYGDEDQIRTVLMNLIGNAVKFTRHGQIELRAVRHGEMMQISVKDTGIGVPPEEQEKIFQEFYQTQTSLTREQGGVGLGLGLTRKIISLHGGRLWVDSIPGKGSEFYFTLPTRPTSIGSHVN